MSHCLNIKVGGAQRAKMLCARKNPCRFQQGWVVSQEFFGVLLDYVAYALGANLGHTIKVDEPKIPNKGVPNAQQALVIGVELQALSRNALANLATSAELAQLAVFLDARNTEPKTCRLALFDDLDRPCQIHVYCLHVVSPFEYRCH